MIRFLQSGNKAAKYLLGGFLLIICVGMVMYLIPGFMTDTAVQQSGIVATVGDQDITSNDLNAMVDRIQQQQRYPDALRPYLMQQALSTEIQRNALAYEAARMGLGVSDQELRDSLRREYGEIFFPNGQWIGQDKYEDFLRAQNVTPDIFEADQRKQVLINKLIQTVAANVDVTAPEIEKYYREQNTKVKFDYAVINADDVQKQIKPTENELKAYYEANKARYQNAIPEKRQIRYFVINRNLVESKITVTPADLEQYYRDHQDQYRVPDRVKVRHILISLPPAGPDGKLDPKVVDAARAKAQDIYNQLKAGANFAELANKYSEDPGNTDPQTKAKKGGELGWITKGQTVADFEKTAFSQDKGQISQPVQTSFGFHIIQTEDKESAQLKPLSEVKDQIEAAVKQQKVAAALSQVGNKADDEARNPKVGFDKAAADAGAQVVHTGLVSRTDSLPGMGEASQFMNAAFSVVDKAGPQVAPAPDGYAIFEVTRIVPARTPTFDEFKDRITSDFKSEQAAKLVTQKTKELADRAHAEHDLRKAAKELGASFKSSELVDRNAQVAGLGGMSGAASVAFDMKKGEISNALEAGQNGAVLEITDRQEPALGDAFANARDNIHEQLVNQKRQQAIGLFVTDLESRLQKEGKIKMNNKELNNLTRASS